MASKVFIVTGASKGIGASVADFLVAHGHNVVLAARSDELLEAKKKSHPDRVEYVAEDMTSPNVGEKLAALAVKAFGRIDGLIISHGMLDSAKLRDQSVETFKHVYDVNVFSCLAIAKASLDELRKTKGSIVWLSSGAAGKAYMAWGAYGSSKAAINSISAHIAFEEPDITSVAVAPGRVDTEMQAVLRAGGKDTMDRAQYASFVDAYNDGTLLRPWQPATVIGRLVMSPDNSLSGKAVSWNSMELAQYQER